MQYISIIPQLEQLFWSLLSKRHWSLLAASLSVSIAHSHSSGKDVALFTLSSHCFQVWNAALGMLSWYLGMSRTSAATSNLIRDRGLVPVFQEASSKKYDTQASIKTLNYNWWHSNRPKLQVRWPQTTITHKKKGITHKDFTKQFLHHT